MDYTNYVAPSNQDVQDSTGNTNVTTDSALINNPVTIRTIEPNRSESESTETRLYGAYRNTDQAVRELTPVSTPDAPLVYPLVDDVNPDAAEELNEGELPTEVPLPAFTAAPQTSSPVMPTREQTMEGPYTPVGDKMPPLGARPYMNRPFIYRSTTNNTSISQPDNGVYPDLNTLYTPSSADASRYRMNEDYQMYLPERTTPYYNLSSPRQENMDDFEAADRDMEYLRQLYPAICRRIMVDVEEECDRLEYEGSCMFDEYPDKVSMERHIHRIYERAKDYDEVRSMQPDNEVSANQLFSRPCPGCNWVEDMIRVMFLNEVHNRRRRYRSRRRWFY